MKGVIDRVRKASQGRLDIDIHYAGEIVPAFEERKAVKEGVLDIAYLSGGQWKPDLGVKALLMGGSGFPAGPTPQQNLAWFYLGDGLKLANELFGDWGEMIAFHAGSAELFCHSNVKLETAADFKGIKFRTFGAWGEILTTYYETSVVSIPGGECYSAAERGIIDAFEYCSAGIDWPMGFHEITKYIGIPGIHSPSGGGFVMVNTASWNALPDDLKILLKDEVRVGAYDVLQVYIYEDSVAMEKYREYGTEFFTVSDELQQDIAAKSKEFHKKYYDEDPMFAEIWDNLAEFVTTYRAQAVVDPAYSVFE